MEGVIKTLARDRGFGFIRDKSGTEWFFHSSSVKSAGGFENLTEQDPVTFDEGESRKGPRAENVRRA